MATANAEATKVQPTVDPKGRSLGVGIEGVQVERLTPHTDHRGHLTQIMNSVSGIWDEPVVHAYHCTVRPGRIKGWGKHDRQGDRHYIFAGQGRMVLYDGREDSPTSGRFAEVHFSDESRGVLYIPPGVWHAAQNTGDRAWEMVNFPTRPYNSANPDKYRIDPHSCDIPFDFTLRDG
jgi:dTDP-4-dehydrorhamnose 3,5-epimerase